jgi:asparagine synthase (glutamine-hydrolysing)
MCGLVGFSGAKDTKKLTSMRDSIYHRGPDDEGVLESENFSIGYRRLAIIDLTMDMYPITNEEENISVFLNGEIYNYKALREELLERGHKFKTESDTEVIAHGYEEWGVEILHYLRGMFVIILFDSRKDEVFIARDRLGIKPLYYTEHDGRVIFASEIKAIFSGFDVGREPDDQVVLKFLTSRVHDDTKNTFFKNIKRLMPGHFMVIDNGGNFRLEKYWSPSYSTEFSSKKSDAEYAAEFKEIFTEAVKLHLIGDVPVGVTLSGGLDSSGITALATKLYKEGASEASTTHEQRDQEFYAFSAIHPGETINEEEYIDSVVDHTGVKSVKIIPELEKFWSEVDMWTYFQEEPVISGAPYAYYTVMREARKYVTVLLTGQGGDELLAGYIPYFQTYIQTAIANGQYAALAREVYAGRDLYAKYFFEKISSRLKKRNLIDTKSMIDPAILKSVEIPQVPKFKNLNERLFEDVTSLTTPSLLRYEDKNSMANSLESRVPFFDHLVVEYIFSLPVDQKIKFGWNRYIYREAMKGIIPEKNRLRRSKIGFTNPEWEWIERRKDTFIELFSSETFRLRKYWDADKVLQEFKLAVGGKKGGDILFFWRLFSVEMWLRTFVDKFEKLDTKLHGSTMS